VTVENAVQQWPLLSIIHFASDTRTNSPHVPRLYKYNQPYNHPCRMHVATTDAAPYICRMRKGVITGRCAVCRLGEVRPKIERALAAGASLRAVSTKHSLSYHTLRRHWLSHVSPEQKTGYLAGAGITKDALEQVVADESLSVLDHLRVVRGRLYGAFDQVTTARDCVGLDRLSGRLHENLALVAKITGELQRGPLTTVQNNVLIGSPDYSRAIAKIVSAVAPYPEARQAVTTALRSIDGASGPFPPTAMQGPAPRLIEAAAND
jgi:hypothetical protein